MRTPINCCRIGSMLIVAAVIMLVWHPFGGRMASSEPRGDVANSWGGTYVSGLDNLPIWLRPENGLEGSWKLATGCKYDKYGVGGEVYIVRGNNGELTGGFGGGGFDGNIQSATQVGDAIKISLHPKCNSDEKAANCPKCDYDCQKCSGWQSTLDLTGKLTADGTTINGTITHYGHQDCTFTMSRSDTTMKTAPGNASLNRYQIQVIGVTSNDSVMKRSAPGDWTVVKPGDVLSQFDEVACDPEGRAVLKFSNGTTVTLKEGTQMRLAAFWHSGETEPNVARVEFYLRFGEISASVHKSGAVRSDFVIRTPEMVNSVRGTIFSVRYDEKTRITTVTTGEGTVSSSPINSPEAAVMVTAGQSVQFDANGHVLSRSPINSPGKTVPSNSANAASGSGSTDRVPLKQYFSDARHEYYSTATKQGEQAAVGGGYKYVRIEGYVFRTQQPGTVPLKLYYSPARQDNFTTGTEQGEQAALGNGYKYVMDEGYLYPTERPGTVPLKLYYNPATHDNFTTATTEGDRDALANGYKFAWIEGYLFPAYRR